MRQSIGKLRELFSNIFSPFTVVWWFSVSSLFTSPSPLDCRLFKTTFCWFQNVVVIYVYSIAKWNGFSFRWEDSRGSNFKMKDVLWDNLSIGSGSAFSAFKLQISILSQTFSHKSHFFFRSVFFLSISREIQWLNNLAGGMSNEILENAWKM